MLGRYIYLIGLICVLASGCTLRQAGYTVAGAAAGGRVAGLGRTAGDAVGVADP